MSRFLESHWTSGIVIILIIVSSYCLLFLNKSQPIQVKNNQSIPTESVSTPQITKETTLALTPTPIPVSQSINTQSSNPGGLPSGQISCNYEIPVGPNTDGTADINAILTNLTIGKNGLARASVCIQVNGGNFTLMSVDNLASGSRDTKVTWLAPNGNYTFDLFDDRGGDIPSCTSPILSSCLISTKLPATPTP